KIVMLMNGYSYGDLNNTVGAGRWVVQQGPPTPQQMANKTERSLLIGANLPGNDVYTVNGMAFAYTEKDDIHLKVGQPVRIYLENMLEFDPVNNFHLHGEMFHYISTVTSDKPTMYTD